MLTKADFLTALQATVTGYPALAALYKVQDPALLQHLEAQAAMLALLSAQVETAMAEPFEKARDATVLADAALKGIVRKATPARVRITAVNGNATPFTVGAGVALSDANGNPYAVDAPVTLAAGATATLDATQGKSRTVLHTVANTCPFYQIQVTDAPDGQTLCGIAVRDAAGNAFAFADKFTGIASGDKVFHVESDEYQRTYIRFGWGGVVGYQPEEGEVVTVILTDCFGDVQPAAGSPFAFEYLYTPQHSNITMALDSILLSGQNPPSMKTLRDLCRYPAVYDSSAVYLGEFDLLIRREYPSLSFLSVWNETVEESVRGASVDNINALFVACKFIGGSEAALAEPNPSSPVAPQFILTAAQTGNQLAVKASVSRADDSYRVRFVTPVTSKIAISVAATVPSSYDADAVQQQIEAVLLAEYGIDTDAAKHGALNPRYQVVYALLKASVPALQNAESDMAVTIAQPPSPVRPEHWRYASADSIAVTVALASVVVGAWGAA